MRKSYFIFTIVIVSFCITSCTNNPGFDDVPEIEFIGFTKSAMDQGDLNTDSLFMTFSFRDGDGDLGSGGNNIRENIIITDGRTGDIYDFFKIPDIPNPGVQNGLEGEITIKLFTTCCIFPDSIPPCQSPLQFPTNELNFGIVLKDDAGNESEVVTTPSIILNCN